jgi:putative ABC transport system permease protein
VKKTALKKDISRDIKKSIGRFLSITIIIALGVAFFSGLKISPEDMKLTADKYYDDYNLMDIRVVSTLGLTQDDVKELEKIKGVEEVFGTYTIDALAVYEEKEVVLRVHGLSDDTEINDVKLIEGRMPKNSGECVIEKGMNNDGFSVPLGSTIELYSGKDEPLTDNLEITEYKVVGTVQTPYYLSFEKGNSSIGNGQVRNFIMIPRENFKMEVYTDIFALVEGVKGINSYDDEYFDKVDSVTDEMKILAKERENLRYDEIMEEAREDLEKGKKEYEEGRLEAKEKLGDAFKEIEDAKVKIADGEKELIDEEKKFNNSIKDGKSKLVKAEKDLLKGEDEYNNGLKTFNEKKASALEEFKKAEEEIKKGEEGIALIEGQISQLKEALENPSLSEEQRQQLKIDLQTAEATLIGTKVGVSEGRKQLEQGKAELAKGENELNSSKALLESSRNQIKLEKEKLEIGEEKGKRELEKARKEIETAKVDVAEGEAEYISSKKEVEEELADALDEIVDAEKKLKDVEKGKWYVLDRNSHYSYVDYGGAADRIDALAKIFPIFFALVAALVCLTTMTRMVDEQRVNIGTLKALGYGKGAIASKYIIYALSATILGCVLGIGIGYTVFPTVIFNAYGIMYQLPSVMLSFNFKLALLISTGAILLTTMTAYIASNNELRESPSSLMRPRAPQMGKRILLERIPFIWNRFNFSYKVTIRNIFRYKRRFLMTVFGIAGCTALMLTAFGVKDSIRTVVDRQYGVLFTYDMTVGLDDIESTKHLDKNDKIDGYEIILKEGGSIISEDIEKDISIIVPKDLIGIDNFIHLQDRKNETKIDIPEEGIIITDQISRSLKLQVGDKIKLVNNEDTEAQVEIKGITENYTFNYAYLSKAYYEKIFNKNVEFNEAIGVIKDNSKENEDVLSRELIKKRGITNVSFNTTFKGNFENTIASLNYVVLIMIISAGALAFVVLYNLTNVNISERIREIATIKVLGFYDGEVSAYIYRENTILTIIGTLVGLIMGIFLHRYIMTTVEMDNIMFGLKLDFKSYIISAVLTITFAILVNFAMYYKLKNVEMVESLKSID